MTIDELREKGLIAYEYRRGSHMYHLNTPTSDEDTGGVFICPPEMVLGLRGKYVEQVSDKKSDVVFYEFGRWIELLLKSNPTALESLFAPKDCIIGEVHPAVQFVLDHKEMFLSKECFKTFYGYAVSQIGKARGLNKKIVNPVTERKQILDFCYTLKDQGSEPIKEFLKRNKLDQKYCGLVNVRNMPGVYGLYYDFAAYFKFENIDWYDVSFQSGGVKQPYSLFIKDGAESDKIANRMKNKQFYGYSGIVKPFSITVHNPDGTEEQMEWENIDESIEGVWQESNEVRLSSVPEDERPIWFMTYNKDAYEKHCRDYKEYKEWEENRNPVRYESNLGHNYDSKNVMHCMRLVRMAKELAQGKGFNVVRTWDRDYLLAIRNHEFEYDDIMTQLEFEKKEMEEAIKTCTLPDKPDYDAVNELLINCRKDIYYYDAQDF